MTVKTKRERNKASRIRRALAFGKATDAQRAWLDDYESTKSARGARPRVVAAPRPLAPASPAAPQPSLESDTEAAPAAPLPNEQVPDGHVPIRAFGSVAEQKPSEEHQSTCNIADCPACKVKKGGQLCTVTGKQVWPPPTKLGAETMARSLLGLIGLAVKFFRDDKRFVRPTDDEVRQLGEAFREVAHRRANWVGAVDDLFALAGGLVSYTARATREPSLKPASTAQLDLPSPEDLKPERAV